jgi:hypothetical protein
LAHKIDFYGIENACFPFWLIQARIREIIRPYAQNLEHEPHCSTSLDFPAAMHYTI